MRSIIKTVCVALSIASVGFAGCDAQDDPTAGLDDYSDHAYRSGTASPDFWNWRPTYAGNGDLAIHEGDYPQVEDCIIWDILGTDVHEGVADPGIPPIMQVLDNEIVGPDGDVECVASWEGDLFKLRDTNGDIVLTLWGHYMYDVDISVMPPVGSPEYTALAWHHLVVDIYEDRVYLGRAWRADSTLVGSSTEETRFANPMRKLLLGALARGECGSNGA